MRFLIDEDLPRSTGDLLRQYGHDAIDIRDIGLTGSKDSQIAAYIINLLERFLKQRELVPQIPGKLVIVEMGRVRIRSS